MFKELQHLTDSEFKEYLNDLLESDKRRCAIGKFAELIEKQRNHEKDIVFWANMGYFARQAIIDESERRNRLK